MRKIYISNEDGMLQETDKIVNGCWINLIAPTEHEITEIATGLDIPLAFMKDPLDEEERSRIEKDGENILIIVNLPLVSFDEKKTQIYDTIPLGMIISKNCFITVCLKDNPIFQQFSEGRMKSFLRTKNSFFLANTV